jgi:alpha-1,6-mannosyltransferase
MSGIIFRSELALLLATHTIFFYAAGYITIRNEIIPAGVIGLLLGLTATVAVDSYFWQQFPLWPELSAFIFNVIDGQSSAWGTQPWYFYLVNAIPRLLLNPLTYFIGIPLSLFYPSTRPSAVLLLVPSIAYVNLYSLVSHKEWRFIVYIVPPLTAAAALGSSYLWIRRRRSIIYRVLSLLILLSTALTFLVSTFILLPASSANYPGAHALQALHGHAPSSPAVISVHVGNLACQTGVTRFLQRPGPPDGFIPAAGSSNPFWKYDKTEDERLKSTPGFWDRFDYVLVENEMEVLSRADDPARWQVLQVINGFSGIQVLSPGTDGTGAVERSIFEMLLGNIGVQLWGFSKDMLRRYITRGWWAEIRMEPKIRIMKHVR